jgi:hypothetical protein
MNSKIALKYFFFLSFLTLSYSLTIKENVPLKELGISPIIVEDSIDICKNYQYEIKFTIPDQYPPEVDKVCINNISIKTIGIRDQIFLGKIIVIVNNMQVSEFYGYNLRFKKGDIFRSFDVKCFVTNYVDGKPTQWITYFPSPSIFNWYEYSFSICFDRNVLKTGENVLQIKFFKRYDYYECALCVDWNNKVVLIKEKPLIISFENATIFMYRPKLEAKIVLSNTTTGANVPIKVDVVVENKRDITAYDISMIFDTPGASIVQGNPRIVFEKLEYERSLIGSILIKYLKEGNYTIKVSLSWKDQAGNTYKTTLLSDQITILPPKLHVRIIPQGVVGDLKTFLIEVRDFYSFSPIQDASIKILTEVGTETLYTDSEGKAIYRTSAKGKAQVEVNAKGYPVELVSFDLGITKPLETKKTEEKGFDIFGENTLLIVVIIVLVIVVIILLIVLLKSKKAQKPAYAPYSQPQQLPSQLQ